MQPSSLSGKQSNFGLVLSGHSELFVGKGGNLPWDTLERSYKS